MNTEQPIGGFFGLEIQRRMGEYHHTAYKVNSGRNALKILLQTIQPSKLYIPYYICNSVIQAIKSSNIPYDFYYLSEEMIPILSYPLQNNHYLLYVNYFGAYEQIAKILSESWGCVIIDNTQAFFSKPTEGVNAFYSPRKFFGVPDGGYLYSARDMPKINEIDASYNRCAHLLQRADGSINDGYVSFQKNEHELENLQIKKMSLLTERILETIDYENTRAVRNRNFLFLHKHLERFNELPLAIEGINGPMVYPLLLRKVGLRDYLIKNNVFVATYWKEVLSKVSSHSFEYYLTENLLPLPIDQRYGAEEMGRVIHLLERFN